MAKIDDINRRILQELSANGRLSNAELADRIGLSPSACLRRVQELERAGVILGYRARLNPAALDSGFVVYVCVGLSKHTKAESREFERAMARASQVSECHNVTGSIEYLLRIEVADLDAYKHFHTDVLGTLEQVRSITSYIVMDSPKDERA
ncbi:Lrp/AsnC family transcriptional regulator [Henriciella sp.]|uniref:Lrp/AsnC family transcriptional regulator n=1 Tax=Henriciella sp. TaxID=1968823 RepID=UPI0026111C61|nr:Lrp/AsnC family transcriptional regulator [Henriciella sp.]